MIKGCQREMIVLQTQESRFFESAYFILRRQKATPQKSDMLAEANRIIESGSGYLREKRRGAGGCLLLFFSGFLTGGGVASLVAMILRLCT